MPSPIGEPSAHGHLALSNTAEEGVVAEESGGLVPEAACAVNAAVEL